MADSGSTLITSSNIFELSVIGFGIWVAWQVWSAYDGDRKGRNAGEEGPNLSRYDIRGKQEISDNVREKVVRPCRTVSRGAWPRDAGW